MNTPASHESQLSAKHRFTLHGRDLSQTSTFFAYHVSLFNMPPHKFQMALRIHLRPIAQSVYLKALQNPPRIPEGFKLYYTLYTDPENEFTLYDILQGYRKQFQAYIERVFYDTTNGNRDFRRINYNGHPLVAEVEVQRARYLEPIGTGRYSNEFNGLLFGSDEETFLAHRLSKAPDWDEVRTITHSVPFSQDTLDDVPQITVYDVRDTLQGYPPNRRYEEQSPFEDQCGYNSTVTRRRDGKEFPMTFSAGEQRWWNSTTLNE
jgi:hypothetical protein